MADISKISLPNGTTYNIKDSNALTNDVFNMTPIPVTVQHVEEEGREYDRYFIPMSAIPLVELRRPIYLAFPGVIFPDTYNYLMLYYAASLPDLIHEGTLGYYIEYVELYSKRIWSIDTTTGEIADDT